MYSKYAALPPFPVIFRMLQALTLGRMADEKPRCKYAAFKIC